MKKISKIWWAAGAIIIIAIIVWLFSGGKEEKQISFSFEKAAPANIQIGVTATGTGDIGYCRYTGIGYCQQDIC